MSVKEEIAPVSASQTAAPPSLLDEIMAQTRVQPKSESYDITRQGVSAFIAAMLQGDSSAEPINILAVDAMIADMMPEPAGRWMPLFMPRSFRNWNPCCAR